MNSIKTLFFAFILALINVTDAFADGTADGPGDPGGPGGGNPNPGYPIDDNLIFLLAGGLILGIIVLYKNKIKKASI